MTVALESIIIKSAPGLPDGVALKKLSPGLNVIVGPNASGKSTLSRTLRGALWEAVLPKGVMGVLSWNLGGEARTSVTVAQGRVSWPEVSPAAAHAESDRYALDLAELLESEDADRRIGSQIMRDLYGGYDIKAALEATGTVKTSHRKLLQTAENAERALSSALDVMDTLANEERELSNIEATLQETASSQAALEAVRAVQEMRSLQRQLSTAEGALATFPEGLDRLREDDLTTLRGLEDDGAAVATQQEAAETALHDAQQELANAAPAPGIDAEALEHLEELARAWRVAAERVEQAETACKAAAASLSSARAALFSDPKRVSGVTSAQVQKVEQLLDARRQLASKLATAEATRSSWQAKRHGGAVTGDTGEDAARRAMYSWLALPRPGAVAPSDALPRWVVPAAGGGVVLGLLLVMVSLELALLLAGLLLGAAGGGYLASRTQEDAGDTHAAQRGSLQAQLRGSKWAPTQWEHQAVVHRLQDIETAILNRRFAAAHEEHVEDNLRRAALEVKSLKAEQATLTKKNSAALANAGLAGEVLDLSAAYQAGRLGAWADAAQEAAAAQATLEQTTSHLTTCVTTLREAWPASAGELPAAHDAVQAQCRAWSQALQSRRVALQKVEAAQAAREQAATTAAAHATRQAQFWAQRGLEPDRAQLEERLAQRPGWTNASKAVATLTAQIEAQTQAKAHMAAYAEYTDEALAARVVTLQQALEQREPLTQRRGVIQAKLAAACDGDQLVGLRDAVYTARAALDAQRQRDELTSLTRRVLEVVQQRQDTDHVPATLGRARELLLGFTAGRWRLDVHEDGVFSAMDTVERARRTLGELSDATRVQLRLAVRLAAIEHAEKGRSPLPLCLDEVLNTTDPTRFREVARTLMEVAAAGRQVLYFSAIPEDTTRWEQVAEEAGMAPPAVHQLGVAHAGWETIAVDATPAPMVPTRGSQTLQAWADALGFARPSPSDPASAWPSIFLLPEDPEASHALLLANLRRVGQVNALGARHGLLTPALQQMVRVRTAALDALVKGWLQGRGRLPTFDQLVASGGVSATYKERVRALMEETHDDAEALVNAIEALKGFRANSVEKIRQHLVSLRVIDKRPRLGPADWLGGAIQAGVAAGGDAGAVRDWVYSMKSYWPESR